MIDESYSASCYIEKSDDTYSIHCDLGTDDRYIEAKYSGTSLVDGVNQVMDEIEKKFVEQSRPTESPEDIIARLQEENAQLKAALDEKTKFSDEQPAKKTYPIKDLPENWYGLDALKKYLGL